MFALSLTEAAYVKAYNSRASFFYFYDSFFPSISLYRPKYRGHTPCEGGRSVRQEDAHVNTSCVHRRPQAVLIWRVGERGPPFLLAQVAENYARSVSEVFAMTTETCRAAFVSSRLRVIFPQSFRSASWNVVEMRGHTNQ